MIRSSQVHTKIVGEVRNVSVSLAHILDVGETLSGIPVVSAMPTGLTVTNEALNTSAMTILDQSVPAYQAVLFTVTGGSAGIYDMSLSVGTSRGQTLQGSFRLRVAS